MEAFPMNAAYYFGPEGSFAQIAAEKRFGHRKELIPVIGVSQVFHSVRQNPKSVGVFPVENSTGGVINESIDLIIQKNFIGSGLSVLEELALPISFSLIGNPALSEKRKSHFNLDNVKRVYSHPYPFIYCRDWLNEKFPKVKWIEKVSTSEAARAVVDDPYGVAISNQKAAKIYNLSVLIAEIKSSNPNETDFFVIGRELDQKPLRDKTGMVFSLEHRPGSLFHALGVLNKLQINMTRIFSRPKPGIVGEYNFFVEVEGDRDDQKLVEGLKLLEKITLDLVVVGSYSRKNLK